MAPQSSSKFVDVSSAQNQLCPNKNHFFDRIVSPLSGPLPDGSLPRHQVGGCLPDVVGFLEMLFPKIKARPDGRETIEAKDIGGGRAGGGSLP
eukprot:CAMPEP_0194281248 /NCGR_PEP_ID=MMETSP0169-20130528/20343_1 /TAXON_ID=218684 /ORGANISM="Corethron pennatum, Strain L29A3" /LENGTH=92 /DNA_ID=CAMNT_0039026255 /DNA_START=385 /DNA_END=659 /DNA_ORIENTATION=+